MRRYNKRPLRNLSEAENNSSALPIVLAIIVAALILIGGYIVYNEYKEIQVKNEVNELINGGR